MTEQFTYLDIFIIKMFFYMGTFYIVISVADKLKWWNGSDENGNPK